MRCKLLLVLLAMLLQGCHDVMGNLYDDEDAVKPVMQHQLYIDASSWTDWYFVDLKAVADGVRASALFDPSATVVRYAIPLERLDDGQSTAGIYTYWYDVWGEGLAHHEFSEFYPTASQPEPVAWSFAVHRDNVRTNGGAVLETSYVSMSDLPPSSESFRNAEFTADVWSENEVWTLQDRMLQGFIGNQGIAVNRVLSSWLQVSLPPIPPLFTLNSHVFVLRLSDDTYAALQLVDYLGNDGRKCCLTINYKYPY